MANGQGSEFKLIYSSLPVETREDKLRLLAAIGDTGLKAAALAREPFPMQHIIEHEVMVNGSPVVRVVIVDPNGETASFVSEGIVSSLARIMEVMGEPPYDPPIMVQAVEVPTRSGFKTLNLKPVG